MEFCLKCATRLPNSQLWSNTITCLKCGHVKETEQPRTSHSGIRNAMREGVIVVDRDTALLSALSTTRATCPKCDHGKAYFRFGEVGGEEATIEIQVFRCTRCGHTWREKG